MINAQTSKIIDIIKTMDEKDKLRLAIALSAGDFSNINFALLCLLGEQLYENQ